MNSFRMDTDRLPEFLKMRRDKPNFAVPASYFEQFYRRLQQRLGFQYPAEGRVAFGSPDNYFSELSGRIMDRIEKDTLHNLGIRQRQGFRVPNGYFEANPEQIVRRVRRTVAWQKALSYAVAACVCLGLVAAVAVQYNHSFGTNALPWLADVSEDELLEYVQSNPEEFETMAIEELMEYDEADDFAPALEGYSEEDVNVILNDL